MKKKSLVIIFLAFSFAAFTQGKSIDEVQCLPRFSETTFVTLLSDNTMWWAPGGTNWQKVPVTGLPADKKISLLKVYLKPSLGGKGARLVALMEDNTIWWYAEGKSWEKVSSSGLPQNAVVKILQPYIKPGTLGGGDTRFAAVLEDNTMWWYAIDKEWEEVPMAGLPDKYVITGFGTYQKAGMMGSETRYVVTLADNTVWWSAGKKWQKVQSAGLPAGASFKKFTAYMKTSLLTIEGRLISVLSDESVWWLAANAKEWKKLDATGLPKSYKVKSLEVYQKYAGMTGETRLILLMEDNTIWWYDEDKGWSKMETKELLQ